MLQLQEVQTRNSCFCDPCGNLRFHLQEHKEYRPYQYLHSDLGCALFHADEQ